MDRDGDGVACETDGGSAPAYVPAAPIAPLAPVAPGPVAPAPAPVSAGPTVVVDWTGADCIAITVPTLDTRSQQVVNRCGGHAEFTQSELDDNSYVGANPEMGSAATLSCEILDDRLLDSGVAGDGHDVNCLTTAGQLN